MILMRNGLDEQRDDIRLAAFEALDQEWLVDTARAALQIPSLSGQEGEVSDFFASAMAEVGLSPSKQHVPASPRMVASSNVVGTSPGDGSMPKILFSGHLDHNPVAGGWTVDPFGGVVKDGWLYGFFHMKATCAAYLAASAAVLATEAPRRSTWAVALVCGELMGGVGTRALVDRGAPAESFVLGEPTELSLVLRQSFSTIVRVVFRGSSKHFATRIGPDVLPRSAVDGVLELLLRLGPSHAPQPSQMDGGWLSYGPVPDGFEGLPQISVGSIRAGLGREFDETRPALLPDTASILMDIRGFPGMTRESILCDLRRVIDDIERQLPGLRAEIAEEPDYFPLGFAGEPDSFVVESVARNHELVTGKPIQESPTSRFGVSDASWMSAAGMRGLNYGPSGRYMSRPDERGRVEDLVNAAKVYAGVIVDACFLPAG
jgi:acetylornithine deacetylase